LNCMLYETDDAAFVVDCGSMFPDSETLGVDLIIPDFSYLHEIKHKLKGLVLTHGHEDHIGATPFFLKEFPIPVYGTPFTMGLIEKKLDEYKPPKMPKLFTFKPGDKVPIDGFELDSIVVNHSILDPSGLALKTKGGWIVHLTDWKIDKTPLDGQMIDLKKFSKLGHDGVLMYLCDSTNVTQTGATLSEKEVAKRIKKICLKHKGRIIITMFSSHVQRIQSLATLAKETGRVLALCGRSMKENINIARLLGALSFEGVKLVDVEDTKNYDPDKVMVLVTGTQGEPRSALTRMAFNEFKPFKIASGDLVLFSSRMIPGNEKNIFNVINNLSRHGAKVMYESVHEIHTSGHAHQDELKEVFKRVKPKHFIPIHGSYYHLKRHSELAEDWGLKSKNTFIIENGESILIENQKVTRDGAISTGRVFVDGSGIGDVDEPVLRDRRHLASTGFVTCVVMINRRSGEILREPDLITRGLFNETENTDMIKRAKGAVKDFLESVNWETRTDMAEIKDEVRLTLQRFFRRELERKPIVIPVVLEV
ncbi:MAG: hypothetical protein ACD_73C00440G0001, partial [uncultured bacterium]